MAMKRSRKKQKAAAALHQFYHYLTERFDLAPVALSNPHGDHLSEDMLISPARAAEQLGLSEKTLANWRSTGTTGLRFTRIGHRIMYRQSDVNRFITSGVRQSTSDIGDEQ